MTEAPPAAILFGHSAEPIFGLTPAERVRLSLARLGVAVIEDAPDPRAIKGGVILVSIGYVYDERVLAGLVKMPGAVLVVAGPNGPIPVAAHAGADNVEALRALLASGGPVGDVPGLRVVKPSAMAESYQPALRKREPPYVMPVRPETVAAVERRMFAATYKGATDLVTKYVWPSLAFHVTRWAAIHRISPNAVTALSLFCAIGAFFLFVAGSFVSGLALAWAMTFLDTVDGKLARLTLTSSKWGTIFDHGIDLVHPPFWYVGWASGLSGMPHFGLGGSLDLVLAVIVVGYALGRLQEGLFLALFGIEMHVWRPLDSRFRLITARRNPNLLLLTVGTVGGRPDLGFAAVGVWTVLSLLFHSLRIAQALWIRRSAPITSWLAERTAG